VTTSVRSGTVRRNAVFALIAEASRAIFAAALVLVVTRTLGPDSYGVFALAYGIGALALLPSDFGISPAAARFIAERRDDRNAAAAVLADALRLKALLAGSASAVLFLLAGPLAEAYDEPTLLWPLRATALTVLAQSLFTLCTATFVALGRTSLQALLYVSEGLLELALVASAVIVTGSVTAAAAGRTAAFAVAVVVGLVIAARLLGRGIVPRRARRSGVRLASYAGVLFIVDVAYALLGTLDILLVGVYLDSEQVGLFEAALRMTGFVLLPGMAIANAVAPRLAARAGRRPDPGPLQAALRGLLIVGCGAGAVTVAWASPLVELLLGSGYAESAPVLRTAGAYMPLSLIAPLATIAVNYIGLARVRVPIVLGALAANAGLNVVLIPALGIVGAALASLLAMSLYVPAHLVLLRRSVGLALRPLAFTVARAGLAGAALAGTLAALEAAVPRAPALAAGVLVAPAVFLGALLLTREVSALELRRLPRTLMALHR
jgi:O-antigen/teichoic acid export membrane protein